MFPIAHVGHYLWVLYLIPVLIVAGSIIRSTIGQQRIKRQEGRK